MHKTRFSIFILALFLGGNLLAQSQKELGQLMRNRGEYYFTLNVEDASKIENLGEICSVDGVTGHTVVCYANQQEYDKLLELGLKPVLQTPPSLLQEAKMWDGNRATYDWNSYPTYEQYVSMMEGFPSTALSDRTCTLIHLGTLSNSNHRKLLGVRIYRGEPHGKPKFLYTSTMHGDEVTGMVLMLRLIDELCTSNDDRIINLLNDVDVYIFPCTNPDGTYYGGNSTVTGARRANGNNKDLNRNYRDFFNGEHPDGNSYQEETQWTMALGDSCLFTMGANYHGGSEVMNYCWDWVFQDHADMDWWEYVCAEYVTLSQAVSSSYMGGYYMSSSNYDYDGVTNGATWYSITGSRQDYMNAYAQCREVTVECSTTKTPSASTLPNYWNYNHNAMLTLMEQSRNGVHGVVYDATTGQTIQNVRVSVMNHDIANSFVTTHTVGDFHRPIKGGTYTFVFDKEGYARKFVEVSVADGQRVDLTVYLTPSSITPIECYEQVDAASIIAGPYLMGYRNGSTLIMPTHSNTSTSSFVSTSSTSLTVTPTDDGFSKDYNPELQKIALEPSGANGQYQIVYKGRLLSRSSSSLSWAKPSNSNGTGVNLTSYRWYVNANGIYQQSSGKTYYLYYDGSFKTSTTPQNNITFYKETPCPTTQTVNLSQGWNWFVPTVETTLAELEAALGENGLIIRAQNGKFVQYENGEWDGNLKNLELGQMYRIQLSDNCSFNIIGNVPSSIAINIVYGNNWFGYIGATTKTISQALNGFSPVSGDRITSSNGKFADYDGNEWDGNLRNLVPGQGYIYISKDQEPKTLNFLME